MPIYLDQARCLRSSLALETDLIRGQLKHGPLWIWQMRSWVKDPWRCSFWEIMRIQGLKGLLHSGKLTYLAGKSTRNEDISPIKNGGFPASYVSLPEGNLHYCPLSWYYGRVSLDSHEKIESRPGSSESGTKIFQKNTAWFFEEIASLVDHFVLDQLKIYPKWFEISNIDSATCFGAESNLIFSEIFAALTMDSLPEGFHNGDWLFLTYCRSS